MNEATSADWLPWERVTIDASWTNEGTESVGSDGAEWLRDPEGRHWLHKSSRVHSTHVDGEDWAEVATTIVGKFLGIPCASTRLCRPEGLNGSLSLRIHDPRTHTFVEGRLRLLDVPRVQVSQDLHDHPRPGLRTIKAGHSLATIHAALDDALPPRDFTTSSALTAFDVFAGFLCLDAFVANRDRHEQNWAVLEPAAGQGEVELAPSFDHGSAFGYNLSPSQRERLVADPDALDRWAAKGTAWRLQHTRPPGPVSLLDAALQALRLSSDAGRRHWAVTFGDLDIMELQPYLAEAEPATHASNPSGLSDLIPTLMVKMLEVNQRRFRDAVVDL